MSDDDTSDGEPPALEDADIDDVSSNASVVTDSSESVSVDTEDETHDEEADRDDEGGTLGPAFVVPLKTGSDDEEDEEYHPPIQSPQ